MFYFHRWESFRGEKDNNIINNNNNNNNINNICVEKTNKF